MWIVTYVINDIPVQFSSWGIILEPPFDLNNPQALKSAKYALEIFSDVKRIHDFADKYYFIGEDIDAAAYNLSYRYEILDEIEADVNWAFSQDSIDPLPPHFNYYKQVTLRAREFQKNPELRNLHKPKDTPTKRQSPKTGYVYLLRSKNGDHYKIGKASDPKSRTKTIGIKLPFEVELIHTIHCKDYTAAEEKLHIRFEQKRVNGEWFALSLEDVEWIKSIQSDEQL